MSIKSNYLYFGCLNAIHRYNLSTEVHQVISFLNLPLACDDNIVIMSDGSFWEIDFDQTEIKKLNSPYQGSLFSVCMKNDFIFLGTSFDKLLVCKRNENNSIQVHQTIDLPAYPVYSVNFDAMLSCSAGKSHFTFTYSYEAQQFVQQSVNASKSRIWSVSGDYFGNDLGELYFKDKHIISLFEAPIRQILPYNNCLVCVQNNNAIFIVDLYDNFRMIQQPNIPSKEINCACAFKEELVTVSEDQYLTVYKNASQMFQMRFEASLKSVAVLNDYIVIGGCKNLLCLLKLNSFYQVEQIITSSYQKEVQNFKFTSIVTINDLIIASDSTGFIHVYSLINNNLTLLFTFNLETVVFKLSVYKNQILYSGTQKYGLIDLEFEEIFKIVEKVQKGEINVPLVEIIKNQTSVVEYTHNQQKLHSVLEQSNEELGSGNECFQIKEEICVCFDSGKVILCDEKLNTRIEKDISHSGILCGANIRNQIRVVGWDRIVRNLDMELTIVQNEIIDVYQLHKMIELNEKMVIVGNGIVFE
ncbi:Conserved_hypothetical protein [Hexamita inflata]|uniref:Uncharacterized protein n=1 Tax=Hexamita inflata TaxID=28002 RepID=A0ABP1GHZ7_9EUKA